mmetsp:Transcript_58256/g.114601  ORF Transcript_58256/g.114601 Transcript_58256/m.114601 type:complete len:91 (-) Transcript_58256:14-286(-)
MSRTRRNILPKISFLSQRNEKSVYWRRTYLCIVLPLRARPNVSSSMTRNHNPDRTLLQNDVSNSFSDSFPVVSTRNPHSFQTPQIRNKSD